MSVRDEIEGSNGNRERWSYRVREDGRVVDVRKVTLIIGAGGLIDTPPTFENDVDEMYITGRFNEGNEHMSNEQTVREACRAVYYHANNGGQFSPTHNIEMLAALGLDPDMSVSELQRRLRIAGRVLALDTEAQEMRRTDPEAALLAYLTREDDQ